MAGKAKSGARGRRSEVRESKGRDQRSEVRGQGKSKGRDQRSEVRGQGKSKGRDQRSEVRGQGKSKGRDQRSEVRGQGKSKGRDQRSEVRGQGKSKGRGQTGMSASPSGTRAAADGGVKGIKRVLPAPAGQRPSPQVVDRQHGAPLLQVLHRLSHHRQSGRLCPQLTPRGGRRCGPAPRPGPLPGRAPAPAQACSPSPAPACSREAPAGAGRERLQHGTAVARDLEPRHPAHKGRHRGVADLLQPGSQLVAVVGPDQQLRAFHRGEIGAAPAPVPAARHVGDHGMRVQLRIQVAAR